MTNKIFRLLSLVLLLVSIIGNSAKADVVPIETQYADIHNEIELEINTSMLDDGDGQDYEMQLEAAFAVFDRYKIELEFPLQIKHENDGATYLGLDGMDIENIFQIFDETTYTPAFTAFLEIGVPLGAETLGQKTKLEPGILLQKTIGNYTLFANYLYEAEFFDDRETEHLFIHKEAVIYNGFGKWNPALEFIGKQNFTTDQNKLTIVPELIYAVNDGFSIRGGIPIGLTDEAADWGLMFSLYMERHY